MSLLSKVFKRARLMRFAAVACLLGAGSVAVVSSADNIRKVRFCTLPIPTLNWIRIGNIFPKIPLACIKWVALLESARR